MITAKINNVCFPCGREYLSDIQKLTGSVCTAWIGTCDLCGKAATVTDKRNFNYLNKRNMNIKELRRGIMIIGNSIDKLQEVTQSIEGRTSRQLSLAKTKCDEAMMWTGTFLKWSKLGDNPYAKHDGNRKTVEDIEPLFDATSDTIDDSFFTEGQIVVIDQMREYFGKQLSAFIEYVNSDDVNSLELNDEEEFNLGLCIMNLTTRITESRMWLGMELGRIRDAQK